MDLGGHTRYSVRLVDEPAFLMAGGEMLLPSDSYFWVPVVLNAMGGADWAHKFVPALPSPEELLEDGAPAGWSLEGLVAEVKAAVWGPDARVPLNTEDILQRTGGFVYFAAGFQDRLSSSLESGQAYIGAQAWMHARFDRARSALGQVYCAILDCACQ